MVEIHAAHRYLVGEGRVDRLVDYAKTHEQTYW
jgi:hypothetical protein